MAIATKLEAIQQWLTQTEGWQRVQATSEGGEPVTPLEIAQIAERCEWADLEDMSEVLYAKQGVMHPLCLELGWGNRAEAYQSAPTDQTGVYFFNAYRSNIGNTSFR